VKEFVMSILKSLRVGGVAMLLATASFAADSAAPAPDSSANTPARAGHGRLTKPWNELKDLTEDEKKQILAIHQKALDEVKDILAKEHTTILAVLTDDQRKEVTEIIAHDKTAAKERTAHKPTTRPSGGDAATPAK
jgi:Spy/CpxP family protein refolding chaperone